MLKRYRYRAYPTKGQIDPIARLFGCCRVVFNDALMARETARRDGEKVPNRGELSVMLTASKRTPERAWLADVSAVPLQQALADLNKGYRNFFDSLTGKRKGPKIRPPRLRRRSNRQSARFTRNAFRVIETTHGVGHVALSKIGRVRFNLSRPLPSEPSSVTLIQEPDGRYYVSFVVEVAPVEPPPANTVVGVDVGLTHLACIVRSDGTRERIENARHFRKAERRLARAQRDLSRKQKGSKNRAKARKRVATHHRKVREARLDHHHKLALRLVRENQAVAIEGLNVKGLARTRLAKSVHDAGWGILFRLVHEKTAEYGREVYVVSQWEPTSQVCSVCGTLDGKKPLSVREWTCSGCGTRLDRDYNAAVNIVVAAGLAETLNACGGDVRLRLSEADTCEAGTRRTDLVA